MKFGEVIALYCDNYTKGTDIQCAQNAGCLNVSLNQVMHAVTAVLSGVNVCSKPSTEELAATSSYYHVVMNNIYSFQQTAFPVFL
jgi:hypothetical protein